MARMQCIPPHFSFLLVDEFLLYLWVFEEEKCKASHDSCTIDVRPTHLGYYCVGRQCSHLGSIAPNRCMAVNRKQLFGDIHCVHSGFSMEKLHAFWPVLLIWVDFNGLPRLIARASFSKCLDCRAVSKCFEVSQCYTWRCSYMAKTIWGIPHL